MYCLSTFLQQCGCSFTNFSLCEVYLLSSHFLNSLSFWHNPTALFLSGIFWLYPVVLAVWRQHVSSPLCCSPSFASNFSSSPPAALQHPLSFVCPPLRPSPLTCSHAFCICTTTSAQYFSFAPVSFIFSPPHPFLLPHLRLLFLPLCFALSGSLSAPKKASACDGLYGIAYLVHYFQYTHFSKHNYIQIIPAESQWMSALLADMMGWVKASDVCQAVCDQCTNNSSTLFAEGVQVHRCWTRCVCQTGLLSHCHHISLTQHPH